MVDNKVAVFALSDLINAIISFKVSYDWFGVESPIIDWYVSFNSDKSKSVIFPFCITTHCLNCASILFRVFNISLNLTFNDWVPFNVSSNSVILFANPFGNALTIALLF